jgi:hypothetical protein
MLVLLVYGSDPTLRDGVRALWPWGQRVSAPAPSVAASQSIAAGT